MLAATSDLRQSRTGDVVGTPRYMSPEQALGKLLDQRTDLFSLGVVLYELITGQVPFGGQNIGETLNNIIHCQPIAIARLNYDVPPELERITLKCLQKYPDRRYQSARELMIDLQNLARELEHGPASSGRAVFNRSEATQSFSPQGRPAVAEPFSLEQLKTSDVLLSYAAIDDYPLLDGKPGWVSQLHRNLEVRMEQLSGVTPEDSSESIQALQVGLTAEREFDSSLQRLIWMPGGGEISDDRQRWFVGWRDLAMILFRSRFRKTAHGWPPPVTTALSGFGTPPPGGNWCVWKWERILLPSR